MEITEKFVLELAVKASTDAAGNCGAPHQLIFPMVYLALKEALIDNVELVPTISSESTVGVLPSSAEFTSALCITNSEGKIVEVMQDGTVNIHQLGRNEEAAKIFYESLAQYGFTLLGTLREAIALLNRVDLEDDAQESALRIDIENFTRHIRGKPYNI
jgi:hypothetical protein